MVVVWMLMSATLVGAASVTADALLQAVLADPAAGSGVGDALVTHRSPACGA
ncbi:hypothetical protein [Nocardia cyriacigeorgica]|uniref:hypothetical protein n=1 Tax=Nocardia cyriacigeorgica TaxID=135487 RepID=UPI001486F2C3|nr:hypothetical protein [Nocardia cyriacigeorgica]